MSANQKSPPPLNDGSMLALPECEPVNSVAARDIDGRLKEQRVESLKDKWRRWRRSLKARFPYVRRREFEIMSRMPSRLIDDIVLRSCASDAVSLVALKAPDQISTQEVCLFVTHAARPALKRHTVLHLEHLLDANVPVILILNTNLDSAEIQIDAGLLARLQGVYVRGNRGYDFAAWSHVWKTMHQIPGCTRLYLVNDSVIGPLDTRHFQQMIERIRSSNADVIGLTEAPEPRLHLQSYFLVIQGRALRSKLFAHLFETTLCLPTKEWVVTFYEIRYTGYFREAGLSCEALFTSAATPGGYTVNDTMHRWAGLIADGYPYIKTRIVAEEAENPRLHALVPEHLRGGD